MEDSEKSRQQQLTEELNKLHQHIVDLPATSAELKQAQQAIPYENELKFRVLAEMTSAAIFIYQGRQNCYVNPATEAITGYPEQELLAMNFWDIIHPDFREIVKTRGLARQKGGSVPAHYEVKIVTKAGEERWLDFSGGFIEFKGRPAVMGTAFDITERKRAAEERDRLLSAEREQRLLAETLREVYLALAVQTNPEAVLDEILRQMQRLVPYNTANISLLEGDHTLQIVRWQGYQEFDYEELIANQRQSIADFPLLAETIRTRQPLLIPDTAQNPLWVQLEKSAWIKSYMGVPICAKDRFLGLLQIDGDVPHKFSARDVDRLQPLAYAAAVALENAQLYNQVQQELVARQEFETELIQRNAELFTLQYAAATLASSLDLPFILDTFIHELTNLLAVSGCLICQWDQAADAIVVIARYGLSHWRDEWPLIYPLAKLALSKRVLTERRAFQMTLSQKDADPAELAYIQEIKVKSLLMLPMEFQGQVIGVLEIMDDYLERVFTNQEIAMAQMLANQAASAVQNAQFYAEIKQRLEEQIKAEAELRQSETRQRALLDAIPDAMFRLTRTGQFLDYRRGSETDSVWPLQVEVGQNLSEVFPTEIAGLILEHLGRTLDSGVTEVFEFRWSLPHYTQDYETRLVVSGADEVLGIVRNITKRKQMEEQAMRSEQLAALGRLSAALTHEINNPLQSMRTYLDLMLDFSLEPGEDKKFLQIMRQEVERLNEITRRILNLARPWPVSRRKVFVTDLLQEILLLADKQLKQNQIELITEWQDVAPVLAVPDQLTQVFLNLIINAIEATPACGQLRIDVRSESNQVTVSIINSGPTIDPDVLPHIFEPFFTTKLEGSGLGLWVSHNLVRQHGGSISVENLESNEGVAFIVTLPNLSNLEVMDDNAYLSTH